MPIDTKIKELYNKTKIFFVGTAEQLRGNLNPRSITIASLAEVVIPFGALMGHIYFSNGESPPYGLDNLAYGLTAEGGLRLLLPQIRPVIKAEIEREIEAGKILPIDQSILFEPTGLVGKTRDSYDIFHRIITYYHYKSKGGTNPSTGQ